MDLQLRRTISQDQGLTGLKQMEFPLKTALPRHSLNRQKPAVSEVLIVFRHGNSALYRIE